MKNEAATAPRRILVVEDEYLIAADVARSLTDFGWEIAGPVGSVAGALDLLNREGDSIAAAILDIKLGDDWVDPIADQLKERGIPFIFATAYSQRIPKQYD